MYTRVFRQQDAMHDTTTTCSDINVVETKSEQGEHVAKVLGDLRLKAVSTRAGEPELHSKRLGKMVTACYSQIPLA